MSPPEAMVRVYRADIVCGEFPDGEAVPQPAAHFARANAPFSTVGPDGLPVLYAPGDQCSLLP